MKAIITNADLASTHAILSTRTWSLESVADHRFRGELAMARRIMHSHAKQFTARTPLRVLVVDDHEPWRAVVRHLLNDRLSDRY